MSMPLGAANYSTLVAISIAPSINFTSHKKDSTAAYTLTRAIDNAVNTVTSTTFNGKPAYVLDQTTQPDCQGDAAGVGGGVKSGTVGKEVKPTSGSSSILIEGKSLVREGDTCTMNNENTVGKYVSFKNMSAAELDALADNTSAANAKTGSNVTVDEYDKDGNLIDSYDLDDRPSDMLAGSGGGGGRNPSKAEVEKVIDMIDLSRDVYDNDGKGIPGYPRLSEAEIQKLGLDSTLFNTKDDESGFYASIYKNEKNGGYAVAMRGTEPTEMNDLIADGAQGIGLSNEQYDKAYSLSRELSRSSSIDKNNMTITGHSLGGGLAATAGSVTGYPTYTFNAAGVHSKTLKKYGITDDNTKHVQAYNTKNDPLNWAQDNNGKVMAGVGAFSPAAGIWGYTSGALPQAIGTRTRVPTEDTKKTGHNTDGMRKALSKRL
ncbi:PAAR-like domain-containing protein [Psychrobacter celer]|uniref:PAAR-like domain-containing protein n=1 Tax=Psychrobacter celer TaxID=306572 RepID=UPI003FD27B60